MYFCPFSLRMFQFLEEQEARHMTQKNSDNPDLSTLMQQAVQRQSEVKQKLEILQQQGQNISISDMFEMQMMMNQLAQLSEMATSVIAASNAAIISMARNIKQ